MKQCKIASLLSCHPQDFAQENHQVQGVINGNIDFITSVLTIMFVRDVLSKAKIHLIPLNQSEYKISLTTCATTKSVFYRTMHFPQNVIM